MANRGWYTDGYWPAVRIGASEKDQDRGVLLMKAAFVFPVSSCALLGVMMVLHGAAWAQPVAPATRETAEEAAADAMEAYIYGYPLVTMEMTRRVMTNVA